VEYPTDYPPGYPAGYAPGYPEYPSLPPPVYPAPSPGYPGYPPSYPVGYPGYPHSYPGYPGYSADPYDPYRPTKPPGTNGKAIASLVTSLIGIACCGVTSPIGLILGIMAMRETKRTGQDGNGMALAGTIIGGILTGILAIFLFFWIIGVMAGPSYDY